MSWSDLTEWWLAEIDNDPAYEKVVTPLLFEVFDPVEREHYLDLGGGEGRVARAIQARGAQATVLDANKELARRSGMETIIAELPRIPYKNDTFDGAFCVLTLEHVPDHREFFAETARVVRAGGVFALVINHPFWTAPGSTPITDSDGEALWRPGDYFSDGSSEIPAGEGTVTFHHRTVGELLVSAADAGWNLERIVERPHHELEPQSGIPRLLACGWRLS